MAMENENWYCPAMDRQIDKGLCWEYCFAGHGGPVDTLRDLKKWIQLSRRYTDLDDFHRVCEKCTHCQWT